MEVSVWGLGYIGLPTAAMLAEAGHRVFGYDAAPQVRANLRSATMTCAEEGVRYVVRRALDSSRLTIVDHPHSAKVHIICVPTPTVAHKADLSYVVAACREIAPLLRPGDMVVLESTVPPGTIERIVVGTLRNCGCEPAEILIAHCPERVIPGNIVEELQTNARVIGARDERSARFAKRLYESFVEGEIHVTDCTTAELVKVLENTYRDVNVAFANEVGLLCEELGVDAWEAIGLANHHPRVDILQPGPGVGGHCIPVDPHFLSNANPFVTELIQTARRVNERMPHVVARRVAELVPNVRETKKIAILGASYKRDVDDTRESPAATIVELLLEQGYDVAVHDPHAREFLYPLVSLADALSGAAALVVVTDHGLFRTLDPGAVSAQLAGNIVLDTRNFIDVESWERAGLSIHRLGARRRPSRPQEFVA